MVAAEKAAAVGVAAAVAAATDTLSHQTNKDFRVRPQFPGALLFSCLGHPLLLDEPPTQGNHVLSVVVGSLSCSKILTL